MNANTRPERRPFVLNLDAPVMSKVRESAARSGVSVTSWLREAVADKLDGGGDPGLAEIKSLYMSLNDEGRGWLHSSALLAYRHEGMRDDGD